MPKYRKKPVVVEAVRWTGSNLEEIRNFVGSDLIEDYMELFSVNGTLKKNANWNCNRHARRNNES